MSKRVMGGAGIVLALFLCSGARADIGQIDRLPLAVAAPSVSPAPFVAELILLSLGPLALGLFLWRRWDRLDPVTSPPSVNPISGGIVFFGMFLAGALGAVTATTLLPDVAEGDAEPLWIKAVRLGSALGAQAVCAVATRPLWCGVPQQHRQPRGLGVSIVIGVAALLIFWPMVNFTVQVTSWAIELLGGPPAETIAHDTLRTLSESPRDLWFWVIVLLVVVPGPVLEEVLYRGILQSTLRSLLGRPWLSIGVTSLGFAAMHFDVAQPQAVAGIFVLSLGFGWVYERTGRLIASALMHVGFNLGNIGLTMLLG